MNKKNNRKGFTIVELVIVIAVIAILATVLVPTFGNVISNANKVTVKQEARNLYTEYVEKHSKTGDFAADIVVEIDNKFYAVEDGVVKLDTNEDPIAYDSAAEAAGALGVTAGGSYVVYSDEKAESDATLPTAAAG